MTEPKALATSGRDVVAALARGSVGAIPVVGSMVAEVVDLVIPGQKLDRVVAFVESLGVRIGDLERQTLLEQRIRTPEGSDLLEEGIVHASRAVSGERRERIASLLANGLTAEQLLYDRTKKLLAILESLNDSELILLKYYSQPVTIGSPWHRQMQEQHPALLRPVSREMGVPDAERQRGAFRDSYERTLLSQGLVERDQNVLRLSTLGKLLLQESSDSV